MGHKMLWSSTHVSSFAMYLCEFLSRLNSFFLEYAYIVLLRIEKYNFVVHFSGAWLTRCTPSAIR